MSPQSTVGDLRFEIQDKTDIPVDQMNLVFRGDKLTASLTPKWTQIGQNRIALWDGTVLETLEIGQSLKRAYEGDESAITRLFPVHIARDWPAFHRQDLTVYHVKHFRTLESLGVRNGSTIFQLGKTCALGSLLVLIRSKKSK